METRNDDLKIKIFSYVCLAIGVAVFLYFCWKAVDNLGKTGVAEVDKVVAYVNLLYGALALVAGLVLFFILFSLSCIVRNSETIKVMIKQATDSKHEENGTIEQTQRQESNDEFNSR